MTFVLKIAAVDHVNHRVNATIHGSVTDNQASLGEEQRVQRVESGCSDLVYSIVSPRDTAELEIYAGGPCKNLGISALRVPIKFIPCSCPLGFEQHKVIKNKCHCICHCKLKQALNFDTDAYCNSTTLLLTRNRLLGKLCNKYNSSHIQTLPFRLLPLSFTTYSH